jgi:hypothetical protein
MLTLLETRITLISMNFSCNAIRHTMPIAAIWLPLPVVLFVAKNRACLSEPENSM